MKFLILAALVAASSAAGLRASNSMENGLEAWYDIFNGKCLSDVLDKHKNKLLALTDNLVDQLRKDRHFQEMHDECVGIHDDLAKLFDELKDFKFKDILDHIENMGAITARAAGFPNRVQAFALKLADPEARKTLMDAVQPALELGKHVKDLGSEMVDCV